MSDPTTQGPSGLDALGGMTSEVDRDNPGPEQKAQTAQAQADANTAEEGAKSWGMLMFTVGGFAQLFAPELRTLYSEERCLDWGKNAYAVAKKYGWDKTGMMPELALAGSTLGFFIPTYLLVSQRIKSAKEGGGPIGWMDKLGLWWRTRKARKSATEAATAAAKPAGREVQTVEPARGSQ